MVLPQFRPWLARWEVTATTRRYWRRLTPPQLLAGSFILLIAFGTIGLRVLPGLYTGERLSWLDALFTATSAVCVTGLVVVDTATYFTGAGQAFVLLLIQLGGLGIVTFTTIIILALGRRLSVHHETMTSSAAQIAPIVDYRHLARSIVAFTLAAEAAGALALIVLWLPRFGLDAVWHSVFHAVSAFCNAGFSTFSDNLIGSQRELGVLAVTCALIVLGGIGFLTMDELYLWRKLKQDERRRRRFGGLVPRVSLHTRIVLVTTAGLILVGWVLFGFFEWNVTLRSLPLPAKLMNALLMSITPRTAGFNSIDYVEASHPTNFLTVLLMTIGGSPGSTAGGLKTTTFAIIGLLAWSRFRGLSVTSVAGRTVPEETVQRAVGLFVVCFGLITAAIFALLISEIGLVGHGVAQRGLLPYMFEAASAFNTVGLSMGLTPELTPTGRGVGIVLMYLGRVGPLTFAAAIALRRPSSAGAFRYAYEDVVIG